MCVWLAAQVPPNMFVGPYPQSCDDVQTMKEAGVTGVVNVQTEKDIRQRMVNMGAMRKYYEEAGIELCHVPIEDFHGVSSCSCNLSARQQWLSAAVFLPQLLSSGALQADLTKRVKDAAHAVHYLAEKAKGQGREPKIYIHCTAGMGRAPATACIYLVWKQGMLPGCSAVSGCVAAGCERGSARAGGEEWDVRSCAVASVQVTRWTMRGTM